MTTHRLPTWMLVLGGTLSLAVAMGIGRFAFTPVLPLMVRAGQLDVAAGGWVAAANYAGYLVGALTAARMPWRAGTLALVALAATALLTAGMALPGLAWWIVARFAAGIASAWVFVATSSWCLGALAQRGAAQLGGWVYAGVGLGIAFAGLHCVLAAGFTPPALWLQLGLLAALFSVPVALVVRRLEAAAAPPPAPLAASPLDRETRGLVLCYGAMGFGYILPATFLPVLARGVVDDPRLFGLAWPVFGAMAAVSTVLAAALARRATRLQVWAASQLLMAAGVLLPGLWPHGLTIALSALLVGGTFMVITLLGVQELRARVPAAQAARAVGRLTAAFALGQIAGPVASALLLAWPAPGARGLAIALMIGAASLLASGLWLARLACFRTSKPETAHA